MNMWCEASSDPRSHFLCLYTVTLHPPPLLLPSPPPPSSPPPSLITRDPTAEKKKKKKSIPIDPRAGRGRHNYSRGGNAGDKLHVCFSSAAAAAASEAPRGGRGGVGGDIRLSTPPPTTQPRLHSSLIHLKHRITTLHVILMQQ